MDLNGDWLDYDPTYPPKEILAPNPGWEGGQKPMANSLKGKGVDMNQLRDPSVFQDDSDDKLYLLYSGNGEGGIGLARLYMTPNPDITLRAVADGYVSENTVTSKRIQISNQAADQRRMYVQFDFNTC